MPKSTKIFRLKEKVGLTGFLYVILWRVGIVNFTDESTFDLMEKVIIILLIFNQLQFMGCLGEAKKVVTQNGIRTVVNRNGGMDLGDHMRKDSLRPADLPVVERAKEGVREELKGLNLRIWFCSWSGIYGVLRVQKGGLAVSALNALLFSKLQFSL